MSRLRETGVGKGFLKLCLLFLFTLFILKVVDFGNAKYILLILFLVILFSLIIVWTSLMFDLTTFAEKILFIFTVIQYSLSGQPIPLIIGNGLISNDYFLLKKKPKRTVLLIRNQSAAIIQVDQGNKQFLRQGIHFLPKRWEILNTLDIGIQKIEFGPFQNEDPFKYIQYEDSYILQQARNDRLQSSKYQTKDQKLIYLSGIFLYQIDLENDKNNFEFSHILDFLNQIAFNEEQALPSGCITDDVNRIVYSLVTHILHTAISQFTFDELLTTNNSHLENIVNDLNLYLSGSLSMNKGTFAYLTENQINSIIGKRGCLPFIYFRLGFTKIWLSPN